MTIESPPRVVPTSTRELLSLRFWAKVDKRGPDECWPWLGATNGNMGHGQLTVAQRRHYAHRAAWELAHGPIPPGFFVCHHCDNPPCCNSAHLFLGTARDNAQDMVAKGRHVSWHAAKTHCSNGHPLSGENLYVPPSGRGRYCRACRRAAVRRYAARQGGRD